jgi:excinuclease ABC subunit A
MIADYVIDIGPKQENTEAKSSVKEHTEIWNTILYTSLFEWWDEWSLKRREGNGKFKTDWATGNNLKNVSIELPLGKMICVTGVSGSGKSTLINENALPILNAFLF